MILRITIFLIALVAAGGAAMLTLKMGERAPEPEVVREEMPTKMVLVAARQIAGGAVLTPDSVRWEAWPETTISDEFILRDDQPRAMVELSGSFVNRAFAPGEPIRPEQLMETNINLLSNKISPGMRATAVKISAESTAGGFILPGDRVDVIHTITIVDSQGEPTRNESQIIITNARVLAIDQTAVQSPEGSTVGETATLELTPDKAARIVAAEASGLLALVLRPVADHAREEEAPEIRQARTVRIHRGNQTSTVTLR